MLASRVVLRSSSFAVPFLARRNMAASAAKIVDGVEFDTIAREWRMKWSSDDEKKSLASVQQALNKVQPELQKLPGLKSVQRVVCGGCLDYKVIVALDQEKYADWQGKSHAPEEEFLAAVKNIPGVSSVETQTYTLMPIITK